MYGVEWLFLLGLLGLGIGLGGGYLLANRLGGGSTRVRELETELTSARQELADYRNEVVAQFSETARKFQTLNDSYTDLHQQLARSSSILCGDVSGPLLAAPAGHQDLLPANVRERTADGETTAARENGAAAHPESMAAGAAEGKAARQGGEAAPETSVMETEEPPTLQERVDPDAADASAGGADIRVAEPPHADAAAPTDADREAEPVVPEGVQAEEPPTARRA